MRTAPHSYKLNIKYKYFDRITCLFLTQKWDSFLLQNYALLNNKLNHFQSVAVTFLIFLKGKKVIIHQEWAALLKYPWQKMLTFWNLTSENGTHRLGHG